MSDFLSPAINDVLKGDDMDERLRDLFFRAAGGISDMGNEEIAEVKRIFLDTIEKAKPEKRVESAYCDKCNINEADKFASTHNMAIDDFESNLKKEIGK